MNFELLADILVELLALFSTDDQMKARIENARYALQIEMDFYLSGTFQKDHLSHTCDGQSSHCLVHQLNNCEKRIKVGQPAQTIYPFSQSCKDAEGKPVNHTAGCTQCLGIDRLGDEFKNIVSLVPDGQRKSELLEMVGFVFGSHGLLLFITHLVRDALTIRDLHRDYETLAPGTAIMLSDFISKQEPDVRDTTLVSFTSS